MGETCPSLPDEMEPVLGLLPQFLSSASETFLMFRSGSFRSAWWCHFLCKQMSYKKAAWWVNPSLLHLSNNFSITHKCCKPTRCSSPSHATAVGAYIKVQTATHCNGYLNHLWL